MYLICIKIDPSILFTEIQFCTSKPTSKMDVRILEREIAYIFLMCRTHPYSIAACMIGPFFSEFSHLDRNWDVVMKSRWESCAMLSSSQFNIKTILRGGMQKEVIYKLKNGIIVTFIVGIYTVDKITEVL